jgi:hypothetical protein
MKTFYKFFAPVFLTFLLVQIGYAQTPKMNEIYSRGVAGNLDWIEIYNPSASSINIGGYKIYDNGGQAGTKPKKVFPTGTVLPANGFYVIITDTADFVGDLSGFGLSSGGEMVWLEDSLGTVIDSVAFTVMGTTQSYGRTPDGGNFKLLNSITRGKSNVVLTSLILPKYMQGLNGTNNNRIPYGYRLMIENLLPSTTYRYINQVALSSDAATSGGAGNIIFVNHDNTFVRTTSTSFTTSGQYGELTTDTSGSFTGWFVTEPTANATRFIPGNNVFIRVRLNDGAGGTVATMYLTTADSIKIINLYTVSADTAGTGIYSSSLASPKDFVFMYDNESGTGRPIAGTFVESDGISMASSTALFYRDSVDNKDGHWGAIIPNILANGIRRIERRLLSDGSIHPVVATDADGIWPSGTNTVNPNGGGTTPIRLESTDVSLPVELTSFIATIDQNAVKLRWKTASELNNRGFEIERKSDEENWIKIGFVIGNGTSSLFNEYNFIDNNLAVKIYSYRLKQINIDGSFRYSNTVNIDFGTPGKYQLEQNYPNPFNPSTSIQYAIGSRQFVTIKVFNVLGNEVAKLVNEYQEAGSYSIQFSSSKLLLTSGTYFYELRAGDFVSVKKMLMMK